MRAPRAYQAAACMLLMLACREPAPAVSKPPVRSAPLAAPSPQPSPASSAPLKVVAGPSLLELCPEMCRRSADLRCEQAQSCEALCGQQLDALPCSELMGAFMRCALREKVEHWECGEAGVASLRDGYCDAEQAAFVSCVSDGA